VLHSTLGEHIMLQVILHNFASVTFTKHQYPIH